MRFLLLCCLSFLLTAGLWCQTDNIIQFIDQETFSASQSPSQGNILVVRIIPTSDGGSLMLGSHLNQFQDRQAYAWKLDALGNEQWSVEQGPASGSNDRFTSAVEMNGEFFLAAELDTDDVPNRRAAIYHYSSSGFLIDTYSYNDLQGNPVQIRTIAVGNNNQLMVGGFYNDVANNNRETGFVDRLQVNQFGIFEVPGALINFGLGYVVTRILKNGPGIYSVLYGAINPNEEGCGVEFILRSDLVVSKRDQSLNEIAAWVVGGVTADYFIDATVRPDGRLAALGFTFCVGELGNTGPLNVASDGDPFWIAELDVIGETGIINAISTFGAFPSQPGNGFESPFAIEYSDCEPSGYLVAAQFYEEGDPSVQYMDVYDLSDGSSENYYAQTAGPNDLYAMRDFTRILNGNFHVAGDLQSLGGTAIVTHLTSDLCTEPINCEAFTSIEGCGNTLVGNLSTQDNLLNGGDYSCSLPSAGDYNGPDRVYRYEHYVGRDFGATLTSTESNLSLFLFDECPANPGSSPYNCVANSQNAVGVGGLDFENIWLENLEPGTYYLVVDGVNNDQTGSYELTINCASGYFCEFLDEYTPIQCGDVLTGDNLSANDYTNLTSNYCGTVGDSSVPPNTGLTAPEHLYRTDIVVGGDYTFELTPQSGEDDFEMYILIAGGGLIDDIFLDFCGDYRSCIGQAAATGPGGTETMTVTLESNESYVIVVDGKLGSEGIYTLSMSCPPNCDLIVYELDCPNLDFYTDASGQHVFTADDPNFTFDFEWQIDGQPLSTVAIDATADIFSLRADLSTYASSDGSVEVCFPRLNDEGCVGYCCQVVCDESIIEPYTLSFQYADEGFVFTIEGDGVSQPSWYYFPNGDLNPTQLGSGFTTFLDLLPQCEVETLYVRYFDLTTNCWRTVSGDFFICDPYLCDQIELDYDFANNAYVVTWDAPIDADNVTWVDDITGEVLATNELSLTFTTDGICTDRFISVRYRDGNGVFRICCLAFFQCDPTTCNALDIGYNEGTNNFDFTLNPIGTVTDIVWINDETGEIFATDVLTASLPYDGDCRQRQITVRYVDENGVTRVCCPFYDYCVEDDCVDIVFFQDCETIDFVPYITPNTFGWVTTEMNVNPIEIEWRINGQPASETAFFYTLDTDPIAGTNTLEIAFTPDQNDEYNICYPYEDENGCLNYCCANYCINVIVEPFEFDVSFNEVQNGFDFNLTGAAVSDVTWFYSLLDAATVEFANGPTSFLELPQECEVTTIYARYFDTASNCWRIVSEEVFLCNPYLCGDLEVAYEVAGNEFSLTLSNADGATNIRWRDDDSGAIVATGPSSIDVPFDGECRVRNFSVRYRDADGVYRICCISFYYCNPYDCGEIDLVYVDNGFSIFWNPSPGATDIVWVDDITGEILSTNPNGLFLAPDGDCGNRFISLRYRDADGVYRICCLAFYLCDPSDCDAVNIDYNVGTTSFDFSFTPNGAVTDIVWINDETGEIIGTDVLSVSLPFDGDCRVRQITIRYVDEEGVTRICCPTYYYCDPYDCGDIASSFNEAADTWTLTLENNPGVSDIVWVNDLTGEVLATGVTSIDLPLGGDCGNRLVSVRFRDADGTFRICCLSFYFCNPFDCEDISSSFDDELNTWNLTLGAGFGLTDIIWYDDTNGGVILGVGGLSIDLPLTGECGIRQVTVRFRDADGVLHVCCLSFYFCDPYECGDISESYDPLNQTWSFEFLNNPGVSDITWVDDETGAILATNTATLLVPFDGVCRNRNISVYFRDIDGNLRLCCLSFYFCDPYDCDDLSFVFNGLTNSFDFTFNPGGPATDIVWRNDDTGEILATNTLTASLIFDGECGVRNVSVRYRDANGVYRICCCTFYFCDPFDCGDITESYDAATSTYTLNLGNNPGVTEIVWTDDETGEILANDVNSIDLVFDGECRTRQISVRFRDQNGVYRICCLSFYFCNPYDCNSLGYTFDAENQNFNFSFSPGGAVTDITWRDDDTGQLLGLNTLNVSVPYDGSCNVRNISVRYRDANGVWRICCAQFFFCDPFDCGDLVESFNPVNTTWTFELTNVVGATEIQWRDDDTGAIFPSVTETLVIPFDGDCRVRNISVRFRDADGIYRICCLSFYYCDPYSCDNLNVTLLGGASGYELFFEPGAPVTDIVWRDDLTGEILDTDVLDIFLEFDGECRDRFISVRYRDAEGVYRICCIVFEFCLGCELPQPSFIPSLTENILSVENTTPGGSDNDYLWSFGSVSNSTAQNPAPVVLPAGLTIVCLQATNDCGVQQFCLNVVTPDFENDLIFDLDDEVCAAAGEIVDIPVYVTNFTDILNFQFSIEMADLSFGSIIGFDFSMLPANIETPTGFLAGPGSATVVWADNQGETLPNDFVFMTVRVQLADIEPGSTPIIFSGNPTAVYAEEGNGDEVIPVLLAGQVNVCRFVDISGIVRTEDGDGIGQTNVFLLKDGMLEATTVTDNSGAYAFLDLEEGHDYSVEPIKDINYLNGVNAGDLTRISSHVLNETLLIGPYKRIAADVRPPNSINSGDISRIRQLVLGDVPTFVDVDSWTFVVAEHVFANPNEPTATPFPRAAIFNNLTGADIVQDFIGMKMGDVNNSSNPLNFQGGDPDFVGNDDLTFAFQSSTVAATNSTYTVDVTALAFTDMIAAQMSIQWDSSQLAFSGLTDLNAELELGAPNFSFNRVDNGLLPWVWFATDAAKTLPDSAVLFRIEFEVLAQNGDEVAINFGSNPTVPYFEDLSMELFPTYEQWLVEVGSPTSITELGAFVDWNLYPNPTTGHFYLSSDDLTQRLERVELYHTNGSLLKSWSEVDPRQRFDLDRLPAAVYLVRLIDGQRSRMIRLVVR